MKTCSMCGETKPFEDFYAQKLCKDGRRPECKACKCARVKANREANIDHYIAYRRAYHAANRDRLNQRLREYWAEYWPAYRDANIDALRAKWRISRATRLSRIRGATVVEKVDLDEIYKRDGARCHICGKHVRRKDASRDHLVPIIRGGDHTRVNVRLAHHKCNSRMGAGRLPAQLILLP